MEIEKSVTKFISKHHVMTIATIGDNGMPRTANLFYAYDSDEATFVFTTSLTTAHGADMERIGYIGANIVLETSNIGRIEGVQIEGYAQRVEEEELSKAKTLYIKRFPFAAIADLELWTLRADFIKMTNNKLGFGKKIIWKRCQK